MKVSVIAQGQEFFLIHPFWVLDWDNLGMPPVRRLSERGPQQHGDTDTGYRLEPRFPTLIVGAVAETPQNLWDLRDQLLSLFHPGQAVILRFDLENGMVRQLDCHYFDGMNMPSQDRRARTRQKAGVILKAGNPSFYDPAGQSITFQLGGGVGVWSIPWTIPWTIGASSIDETRILTYQGSFEALPTLIRITGPITNPLIINETIGDKLDFSGVSIAGGDWYDIYLQYGSKRVVDSTGASKLHELSGDSDHATWRIADKTQAVDGINIIRVSGTALTTTTKIEINWLDRYLGI